MKPCIKFVIGLVIAAVFLPCLAREPMTLARIKELGIADAATPEGKAYLKEFFTNPWMVALDDADEQCKAAEHRAGPVEDFELGLTIGLNGYPTEALVSPDNEGLKCIADRLKATGLLKPPRDGFAIYLPFKHVEPGTEGRFASPMLETPASR